MWKCKEWWNIELTLGIWCRPFSQHPLPPVRHQPHLVIPSAQTICPPTHTLIWINHPHLSHPPIIHHSNTMDTEFSVQMRQSNKCGSVRNDEIFNLHLGSGAGPWVSIPCLLQDTSHIYWFHPPNQIARKNKEPRNEIQLPTNRIVQPALRYVSQHLER